MNELEPLIDKLWERRADLSPESGGDSRLTVERAIAMLDAGVARVAEPTDSGWQVNQWMKKAVLLSFRINSMKMIPGGPGGAYWWDKVPSKFVGWSDRQFAQSGFRAVPGAIVRRGAYIAPGAVLMPSFVNIGAYVGENSMIDTWATIGSCAQIGRNVHISGPVIIEDDCFIGARSEVAEGVIVEKGSVLSMGVFLGASTKIVDRATGEIHYGRVPAYSVVVPGSLPGKDGRPGLACAVIVKRVDEQTRSKTSINELLRD